MEEKLIARHTNGCTIPIPPSAEPRRKSQFNPSSPQEDEAAPSSLFVNIDPRSQGSMRIPLHSVMEVNEAASTAGMDPLTAARFADDDSFWTSCQPSVSDSNENLLQVSAPALLSWCCRLGVQATCYAIFFRLSSQLSHAFLTLR